MRGLVAESRSQLPPNPKTNHMLAVSGPMPDRGISLAQPDADYWGGQRMTKHCWHLVVVGLCVGTFIACGSGSPSAIGQVSAAGESDTDWNKAFGTDDRESISSSEELQHEAGSVGIGFIRNIHTSIAGEKWWEMLDRRDIGPGSAAPRPSEECAALYPGIDPEDAAFFCEQGDLR